MGTARSKKLKAWDQLTRELSKTVVAWPKTLPRPKCFPATLKHFLGLVVKAKTPADSTARLRQFLTARGEQNSHWVTPQKPQAERAAWAAAVLAEIKAQDAKGGHFTELLWLQMGSEYLRWWKCQKSISAQKSAKSRSRTIDSTK